jgi:hypothetical protein
MQILCNLSIQLILFLTSFYPIYASNILLSLLFDFQVSANFSKINLCCFIVYTLCFTLSLKLYRCVNAFYAFKFTCLHALHALNAFNVFTACILSLLNDIYINVFYVYTLCNLSVQLILFPSAFYLIYASHILLSLLFDFQVSANFQKSIFAALLCIHYALLFSLCYLNV